MFKVAISNVTSIIVIFQEPRKKLKPLCPEDAEENELTFFDQSELRI